MTGYPNAAAAENVAQIYALRAAGPIVVVEPDTFENLLSQLENPLVVYAPARWLQPHRYLTNYRGLFFAVKASKPLALPKDVELVTCKRLWLPSL
jgi:hypothetical protein